ncbi:MAG: ABC transporter ATP-binding protein, partial [Actinomycetota bacterium]|nr:ABC transporter ATP-binding protein [Actinomycetota bacterium]
MANIKLINITKIFKGNIAINNLSLEIHDKEFLVLLGPSGCGKTTTLRSIAGLETVDSGEIWIDNIKVNNLRASDRDIAFVFQLYALYPHLTAYQNIAFPLRAQHLPKTEIKKRIHDVVELLGIEHILSLKPKALSGGDLQRVALGRAIVRRPKAFLMDEPIGTLDSHFREKMRSELRRLHIDIGATTVYVTHDQVEAMSMGDRITIINSGILQQIGTPLEIYNKPANLFVAKFIGSPGMVTVDSIFKSDDSGNPGIEFGGDKLFLKINTMIADKIIKNRLRDKPIIMGIRCEDVKIQSEKVEDSLAGKVYISEKIGPYNIINININGGIVKAKAPTNYVPETGSEVWFNIDLNKMHI